MEHLDYDKLQGEFPTKWAIFSVFKLDQPGGDEEAIANAIPVPGRASFHYNGESVVMNDATWKEIMAFFDRVIEQSIREENLRGWDHIYLEGLARTPKLDRDNIPAYEIETGS